MIIEEITPATALPNNILQPDNPGNNPMPAAEPVIVPAPPSTLPRKQFEKTDNPKSEQFTGRATVTERDRINRAISARKQPGKTYDIVRLALDMLDHIESDFLQTFKTK